LTDMMSCNAVNTPLTVFPGLHTALTVELRLLCTRQMDTQTERQHADEELCAQR
ncbi:hypothetical protein KUCAC02_024774, partial [Chaenocephalus aceratus]